MKTAVSESTFSCLSQSQKWKA